MVNAPGYVYAAIFGFGVIFILYITYYSFFDAFPWWKEEKKKKDD